MHPDAAKQAAQPHLSLSSFSAQAASREERNGGGDQVCLSGANARDHELQFGTTSTAGKGRGDSVQWVSSASYPVLCSESRFGAIRRPAARRRSASALPPSGLRFPSTTDPP